MPYSARSPSEFLHFTRKERKIAISLQQYDLSPQSVVRRCRTCFSSVPAVKKFSFKNSRCRTADTLEKPVVHHHAISRFFHFQDGGCLPSWIFEIEIFNSHPLQRHVLQMDCVVQNWRQRWLSDIGAALPWLAHAQASCCSCTQRCMWDRSNEAFMSRAATYAGLK